MLDRVQAAKETLILVTVAVFYQMDALPVLLSQYIATSSLMYTKCWCNSSSFCLVSVDQTTMTSSDWDINSSVRWVHSLLWFQGNVWTQRTELFISRRRKSVTRSHRCLVHWNWQNDEELHQHFVYINDDVAIYSRRRPCIRCPFHHESSCIICSAVSSCRIDRFKYDSYKLAIFFTFCCFRASAKTTLDKTWSFLARDVIYTSRAYATMSMSVCLSVCLWRKCIGA